MPITTHRKPSRDLTAFTCKGDLSFYEIQAVMERFYKGTIAPPTKKVLWDMRNASAASLTAEQISHLANFSLENEDVRESGKTAVLVPKDIDFGLARTFQAQTISDQRELMIFREKDEAMEWLEE
jgi:hypothetical protein